MTRLRSIGFWSSNRMQQRRLSKYFRIAQELEERGTCNESTSSRSSFRRNRTESQVAEFVQDAFGVPEKRGSLPGTRHLHAADVSIATHWRVPRSSPRIVERCSRPYSIQDFEPEFYAADHPLYREAAMSYGSPASACLSRPASSALRLEGLDGIVPGDSRLRVGSHLSARLRSGGTAWPGASPVLCASLA